MLSDIFSTITSSLPALKISKWDVQVLKKQDLTPKPDGFISSTIASVKAGIRSIQDAVAGIFQNVDSNYVSIAEFDSFISCNGSHDSQIVKNAIENGSFRSVNKIRNPDSVIVELAKGGYRTSVEAVLSNLKKYQNSTLLCKVVTPFGELNNLNLVKLEYSYTRDNGSNLLVARLHFQEIIGGSVKQANKVLGVVSTPDKTDTQNAGKKPLQSTSSETKTRNLFGGNS